ncbi:hypothetical protein C1Y31_25790 [Pseudomonas sp. FW305-25]|nr:hypothetical protein C1Y31_25790 [Pseudomonas sp. FW305-25]PMY64751.1 hypothetical protein C1Y32_24405 [Pseudomonas sp. FW126-L8]PNA76046.1 hypothetical protein C1Y33_20840 [Pseudomonas sp. FW305-76]
MLLAVALTVASASSVQAADRFQLNTELTLDGKTVEHMTAYVENGETLHYLPKQSQDVMQAKDPKVKIKNNEERPVGLEAHITARLNSKGKILLNCKGSYVGFYHYRESIAGVQSAEFWVRNLTEGQTVELGEPARFKDAKPVQDGHDAFITVTVTRI